VSSVRARVVKTDQSELFHKIALRKWMLLTRLDRVRVIINNENIWCIIVIVRARVLNTDQSELFHKIIQRKWKFLHN
jgi:hypothetical protein